MTGRSTTLWPFITLLAAVASALVTYRLLNPLPQFIERENINRVAVGNEAKVDGWVGISLQPPTHLGYRKKVEILDLRTSEVLKFPTLIVEPYRPSDAVFGEIVDDRPWWSMKGLFMFYFSSPTERSQRYIVEGVSEETRFIMNPFLLVGLEFFFQSQDMSEAELLALNLDAPNFKLFPEPSVLEWNPKERRARVSYDVSSYLEQSKEWRKPLELEQTFFDLITYNARDFNLEFLQFVAEGSEHLIPPPELKKEPIPLRHFLHLGGRCGLPIGCNNMSPAMPEIQGFGLTALPARILLSLRRKNSENASDPDMEYLITLK